MIGFVHQTVLQSEVAALLAAGPGRVIFDGTLGGGGHAQALLDAGARVVAIDQDPAALAPGPLDGHADAMRMSPFN